MIYGAVAASDLRITVPDIEYETAAVNFDGTAYLSRGAALTGWGTPSKFTAAIWTKLSAANDGIFSDANYFLQGTTADGANKYINFDVADTYIDSWAIAQIISGDWQCILASMDLTDCPASAKLRLYVGDSSVIEPDDTSIGSSTTIAAGSDFWFGQDGYGVKITGDVADFRLWVGQYVDFSLEYKRRLFIRSNGKPASPSLATASLGTPIISFIADPADPTGTFVINGGSGGPFTLTGSLTTASTTPTGINASALFAGIGSLSVDVDLTNPLLQSSASFAGSGLLSADSYLSTPIANIGANFAGAGTMTVSGFWLDGHIVYSQALNTDGASAAGISVRSIYTISEAASQVRIKLRASSTTAMVTDHVSIGKQSSTYNTVATPVEIKFSGGASGFNIAAGQTITSDWTDFAIAASDVVIIIVDYNDITSNATRYTDGAGSRYFATVTDSWNVASPGGSWGNDTRAHATYEIDVR